MNTNEIFKKLSQDPDLLFIHTNELIREIDKKFQRSFDDIEVGGVLRRLSEIKRLGNKFQVIGYKSNKYMAPFYHNWYDSMQKIYTTLAEHHDIPNKTYHSIKSPMVIGGKGLEKTNIEPFDVSFYQDEGYGIVNKISESTSKTSFSGGKVKKNKVSPDEIFGGKNEDLKRLMDDITKSFGGGGF